MADDSNGFSVDTFGVRHGGWRRSSLSIAAWGMCGEMQDGEHACVINTCIMALRYGILKQPFFILDSVL